MLVFFAFFAFLSIHRNCFKARQNWRFVDTMGMTVFFSHVNVILQRKTKTDHRMVLSRVSLDDSKIYFVNQCVLKYIIIVQIDYAV